METKQMFTIGLGPFWQLVSLLAGDEGDWRYLPEGQTAVPLVKIPKSEFGAWESNAMRFADRVERQWFAGTPQQEPTSPAAQIVSQYFSTYQITAPQDLEMAPLTAGNPLGVKKYCCKDMAEKHDTFLGRHPRPRASAWKSHLTATP
jgi:DNA-directed RNA polymerase subunit N (RpoN/RPB10)